MVFFAGCAAVDDLLAGRFLDWDDPEVDPEAVADVVGRVGLFAEYRKGL